MRRLGIVIAWMILCLSCEFLFSQQPPTSSAVSSSKHSPVRKSSPDPGSTINGTYRNIFFQFSYQPPFGWVDRTSDMREDTETGKSKVLLAIFERPPAASGSTVNSAVVIAAESADSYPGLKDAADYFGPLTELTESKGFKVDNEPYEFPVDGRPIIRRDFSKNMGSLTMRQSSLAMISRGYILSFTFIASSDDDVTELIRILNFAGTR